MEARPVPHPSADSLRAFGLGKMDDTSAEAVMNHLDVCLDCRKVVASLSGDDFLHRFRQAHSRSGTPAPPNALPDLPRPAASVPGQPAIPNLPPELANHPEYQILRELGRGGMGVVYLARNKPMDRLEVLKVVNKALLNQPGALERFQREIRSAARLSHANIVTAYSVLHRGEFLAFAMEYIPGQDLAGLVKARGPLPVPYACYYVQQVAFGLQHAFEKGMVHRDIKPQNLMLARDGARHLVKILDFGLAKATREKGEDTGLTGEGKMLGTPDYMAPEQTVDAARADIRADVYSLGCTLYYLLTGGPPFTGRSLYEILQAHHSVEARAVNLTRPEVPAGLAAVVRKMMAKDPAQRYQKPIEVVQALGPFIRQSPASVPPQLPPTLSPGTAGAVACPPPVPQAPSMVWDTLTQRSSTSPDSRKGGPPRTPPPSAAWRKRWLGAGIGGGVLLLTLLVLWASGVFKVKTKDGTIVLENVPDGAEVTVDGAVVQLKTGDGKTVTITITSGKKHQLQVKKEGFTVFGEEVEIDAGERRPVRVRMQPATMTGKPPPPTESPKRDKGFVPLFNGKDLAGWKTHPAQPDNWRVKDGILVGSCDGISHLYTNRGDYTDFHLRLEARLNGGTGFRSTGVYFRAPFGPNLRPKPKMPVSPSNKSTWFTAYNAKIDARRLGGLLIDLNPELHRTRELVFRPDEWLTFEVIAEGNHIVIKVNGQTTADYTDELRRYTKGHIILQQHGSATVAEFRKVEIKELPPASAPDKSSGATELIPPARQRLALLDERLWNVEKDTLVRIKSPYWKGAIVFGDASWKDYTYSFEVKKLDAEKPFGVFALVRATDLDSHYSFAYGGYANGEWSELVRLVKGRWARGHNPREMNALCRKIKPMEKGRWYSFAVTVTGEAITCRVDGIKMFTWKDDTLSGGKVGLKASPGQFVFRKIKVTAPDGKVLWEGAPDVGSADK